MVLEPSRLGGVRLDDPIRVDQGPAGHDLRNARSRDGTILRPGGEDHEPVGAFRCAQGITAALGVRVTRSTCRHDRVVDAEIGVAKLRNRCE